MADRKPKTLAELSRVITGDSMTSGNFEFLLKSYDKIENSKKLIDEYLIQLVKTVKSERERLNILEDLHDVTVEIAGENSALVKSLRQQILGLERVTRKTGDWRREVYKLSRIYDNIIKQNSEIFKISHEMQLESNVTWKNYTKLYQGAYESAREMNREFGKSLVVAKDLVETQNKLLGTGWKNIQPATLTKVSSAVALLQNTLGSFPTELANAFQISYRQFGDQTDKFVTNLGNRLNAFSDTFGVNIGMLAGAVADMMESNSFLARNNMKAQTLANESLIKAAALSGAIGLTSTSFLSTLAGTAQFGTMEEMAQVYQGGALLQGFDTASFQNKLIGMDYEGATTDLFSSISDTLNGISDHYLRAEYMKQIGGTFGMSREDLLMIMQNGENLNAYSEDLQEKLKGMDMSMTDEIRDLRMNWPDRFERWLENTPVSQGIGGLLQELGLYGTYEPLKSIANWVHIIGTKYMSESIISGAKTVLGSSSGGATQALNRLPSPTNSAIGMGTLGKVGLGVGGAGILTAGNMLGSSIQGDLSRSDASANTLGGMANIGSGIIGGAMIGGSFGGLPGAAIGAGIGGIVGGINTILSKQNRDRSIIEDISEKASSSADVDPVQTSDPIVNAINQMNANLTNVLNGNFTETRRSQFVLNTYHKTTTYGET